MKAPASSGVPLTISDQSCRHACGLEPKSWKRAVVALQVPYAVVGRRWVVASEDWLAAIRREANAPSAPTLTDDEIERLASRRVAR